MKSFTQSCTEFFLIWIMLSEFHRGVALVGVVGRGLTALSHSLLRRRFLLRRNDNCSQMRGICARVASQWNSYMEYKTSCLAPMGAASFYKPDRFLKTCQVCKRYSGQRDQESLWNAKWLLLIFFNIIPYIYCMDFIIRLYLQLINFKQ